MKKATILFFFINILSISFAQKIILEENFSDNSRQWNSNTELSNAQIIDGKLLYTNLSETQANYKYVETTLDTEKEDFDIQMTMTIKEIKGQSGIVSFLWAMYPDNSYYKIVSISNAGHYQVYSYNNGTYYYDKEWTKSTAVEGLNQSNTIKISKRANYLEVYINGEMVYNGILSGYFGKKVGMMLNPNMTVEFDDLKVSTLPSSIKIVNTFDAKLQLEKLNENVSSKKYMETNPVITADGNTLFFVRRDSLDTNHDVWYSVKNKDGGWGESTNIGKPINNDSYNFVISVSPDNNSMVVGNTYDPINGKIISDGLSITYKSSNGWTMPKKIEIENFENKNTYVSFFVTSDNKYLLQCVERTGGFGLKDIYVSTAKDDKSWSSPINLGNIINTPYDEINPFLASDGKTLYFSSEGHKGFGGYDVFVCKRLDDTWTNWSAPENLGPVINEPFSELGIFLSAKGDRLFLARDGDIWEVANTVKQDPVVLIKGKVYDAKTKAVISAPIIYADLMNNKELGTAISDPSTGAFSMVLPYGQKYSFMAEKSGYYAVTENIDLTNLKEYKEINVDLYLNPIEKGQVIRLNNIFFESGKYALLKESYAELDKLFEVLQNNSKLKIEIAGHTDNVGSDETNEVLSKNRAEEVKNYLLTKGIDPSRIKSKGYGETKFVATNETEVGRQLNRRVEFTIVEL